MFISNQDFEVVGASADVTKGENPEKDIYISAEKAGKGQSAAMAKRQLKRLEASPDTTPEQIEAAKAYLEERQTAFENISYNKAKKTPWLLYLALGIGAYFMLKG